MASAPGVYSLSERAATGASDQVVDRVGDRLADPRDEGDLLLREPPRLHLSQAPDRVDDRIELGRFEREDPLPVAEAERARRVPRDLRELAAGGAVRPEHLGTLLCGEEIPLRGADEGVDAQVRLWGIAADER